MTIFVYSENNALAAELVALAKGLEVGNVCVLAAADAAEALANCGADTLITAEAPQDAVSEDIADTLAQAAQSKEAQAILIGATRAGRAVAARVAAAYGTVAIADATALTAADGAIEATRLSFGGKLQETLAVNGTCTIAIVGAGKAEAIEAPVAATETVAYAAPANAVQHLGWTEKQKSGVDLTSSDIVVCAGRGAASPEGIEICRNLAEAMGGDLGCSRPVSEGDDPLLPTDLYIGATGVVVAPRLYVAVGVSGQTQHTMGMLGSKVVVAVDKNADCLMFRQADYCLTGDLKAIVPALTAALQ